MTLRMSSFYGNNKNRKIADLEFELLHKNDSCLKSSQANWMRSFAFFKLNIVLHVRDDCIDCRRLEPPGNSPQKFPGGFVKCWIKHFLMQYRQKGRLWHKENFSKTLWFLEVLFKGTGQKTEMAAKIPWSRYITRPPDTRFKSSNKGLIARFLKRHASSYLLIRIT